MHVEKNVMFARITKHCTLPPNQVTPTSNGRFGGSTYRPCSTIYVILSKRMNREGIVYCACIFPRIATFISIFVIKLIQYVNIVTFIFFLSYWPVYHYFFIYLYVCCLQVLLQCLKYYAVEFHINIVVDTKPSC